MPFHDPTTSVPAPTSEDLPGTPVYKTKDRQEALSCSLMLSSVGISHNLSQSPDGMVLGVTDDDAQKARIQISTYLHENRNWPPRPTGRTDDFIPMLQPPTLLLIGALSLFYTVTGPWSDHSFWFTSGAGDATAILQNHEYYRLVTALTLHADSVHLLGNCLFGGFLFHFFCRLTGNGLGMFAMIITATLANYINVLLHGSNHLFIGFSTAVFAIIGSLAMISRKNRPTTKYSRILPFMAGAALLAMIGSSGERTDLGAHFFGLCCGLVAGWALSQPLMLKMRQSLFLQTALFLSSLAIITFSWQIALS
ncbi:MAG TPA: rhomboid family intramembrane serine protease [Desulfobacterales bacterium]|nr:rhomboid family intramembrane serine protease [Desulfobacterales bacterium]HIP40383.1 rhomboid family intramembrane serine protease [Desulfocapsa sulfexigens]